MLLLWRGLCDGFVDNGFSTVIIDAHFLAQLALFAARHHLNTLFLLRFLSRLLFAGQLFTVQLFDFLLRLTFVITAAAVAFTT